MDDRQVFANLKKQKKEVLLDYLREAFAIMTVKQQREVFGDMAEQKTTAVNGPQLQKKVVKFYHDSLAGEYYAPFNIDSTNFMDVPEETEEWCELFAEFAAKSCKLTEAGEHAHAVRCFDLLNELYEALSSDEEIIFGDEIGDWMIPIPEKVWKKAYRKSRAATAAPKTSRTSRSR